MLQVIGVHKSFGSIVVLEDVSFSISGRQKVGLIGQNGAGKSTLLKILNAEVEADKGEVIRKGKIGFLEQTLDYSALESVYDYLKKYITEEWEEYRIFAVLAEAGLEGVDPALSVGDLSGGQKTKLGIARLLLTDCDILFLDEPTNNMDSEGLKWLESFVKGFNGIVFVISHDRTFLDNTVHKILELNPFTHSIVEYTGGYSDYVEERTRRFEKQMGEFSDFDDRRRYMEEWIALKKQKLTLHADPKGGRQLRAFETKYERFMERDSVDKPRNNESIKIGNLGGESHRKKIVYFLKDVVVKDLFIVPALTVYGGDRIHLKGKNGSGKSTLLKIMNGELQPNSGDVSIGADIKIGYFSQEHEILDFKNTVIDELLSKTDIGHEGKARTVLGKYMIKGVKGYNSVGSLSQGERVKLILAILTHQHNQFLILDEPTNHLDIESREVLESALRDFEGGFIVVSHDRYFLQQIGINREISIRNKTVVSRLTDENV